MTSWHNVRNPRRSVKHSLRLHREKSLPPANEVWGKVICLQACVCPQWGGVVHGPGGGAWSCWVHGPGGVMVYGPGGCLVETFPPTTATAAGSTHPTGMHSCCQSVYLPRDVKNKVTVVYAYKGRNLWLYIEKFCVVQTLYSGYKGRSFLLNPNSAKWFGTTHKHSLFSVIYQPITFKLHWWTKSISYVWNICTSNCCGVQKLDFTFWLRLIDDVINE